MPPEVSAIVTTCSASSDLRACLERVRRQVLALDGELLVVVNAAPETLGPDSRGALEKLCDRVLVEPRTGKSNALNRVVEEAQGVVLAFTDDDALPEPGWLAAITGPLLAEGRAPDRVGCGGPVVPRFGDAAPPAWLRELLDEHRTFFLGPQHDLGPTALEYSLDAALDTAVPLGANCAWRRELFATYRYDPRLGPNRDTGLRGGEDWVFAQQILRDGLRVLYCPDARVEHPVHASRVTLAAARRAYYFQGVESVRMRRILGSGAELPAPSAVRRSIWELRRRWLKKRLQGDRERLHKIEFRLASRRGELDELLRPFGQPRPPRS